VPAFATLDDNSLLKIVGASANLAWPAGESVFEKGTPGDALYIVLSGSIAIVDVDEAGETEITRVEAGDFFGEVSLMMDTSHSMSARAVADSELMVLPKESLEELLEGNAELDDYFRRKVEERVPESLSKLS